jgi:predicted DNA-binding transcriptional regulator YafY
MGRNKELIRQWNLLRRLASERTSTIPRLAADFEVTTRTIRRDLVALQAAGFPIYDHTVNGTKFWRMDSKPLGGFAPSGITFAELCALYFSRALLECFAGTHVLDDLQSALDKFEAALSPAMKRFLDKLPRAIRVKGASPKRAGRDAYDTTSRLLQAVMDREVLGMRYHSASSGRTKEYLVHPYRLVYAQGGLYLMAFVPAYSEIRTFAIERIKRLSPREETFTPVPELDAEPFEHSLGVHRGPASKVQLRFRREVAQAIQERTWHPSQQFKSRADGSVVMTLDVSEDYALRAWIMGFGHYVRVLAPASLVNWAIDELEQARGQYGDGGTARPHDPDAQPALPFLFPRLAEA